MKYHWAFLSSYLLFVLACTFDCFAISLTQIFIWALLRYLIFKVQPLTQWVEFYCTTYLSACQELFLFFFSCRLRHNIFIVPHFLPSCQEVFKFFKNFFRIFCGTADFISTSFRILRKAYQEIYLNIITYMTFFVKRKFWFF